MSGADQILVAHALAHECIVVTNETFVQVQPPPSEQSNVKIPNVCKHFGIKTKTLVDVLRATGQSLCFLSCDTRIIDEIKRLTTSR